MIEWGMAILFGLVIFLSFSVYTLYRLILSGAELADRKFDAIERRLQR